MIVREQTLSKSRDTQALEVHILTSFGLKFGQDFRSIPYINLTIMSLAVERRQNLEQQKAFGTS